MKRRGPIVVVILLAVAVISLAAVGVWYYKTRLSTANLVPDFNGGVTTSTPGINPGEGTSTIQNPSSTVSSVPALFLGGYEIANSVQSVDNAASLGIQVAQTYQRFKDINPVVFAELRAKHMRLIPSDILDDVNAYGCWHAKMINPPRNPSTYASISYCPAAIKPYLSVGTNQALAEEILLNSVTSDLNYIKQSPNGDLVYAVDEVDDWFPWDWGSVQQLLKKVNAEIHSTVPGLKSLCTFGGADVPLNTFNPTVKDPGFSSGPLQNFSPQGCDMAGLYMYAVGRTSSTIDAGEFDWSMQKVLNPWIAALEAVGMKDAQTHDYTWDGNVPLVGIGQVWGGTTQNQNHTVYVLPTAADIVTQETAFCKAGMSILPYAWIPSSSVWANLSSPITGPSSSQSISG